MNARRIARRFREDAPILLPPSPPPTALLCRGFPGRRSLPDFSPVPRRIFSIRFPASLIFASVLRSDPGKEKSARSPAGLPLPERPLRAEDPLRRKNPFLRKRLYPRAPPGSCRNARRDFCRASAGEEGGIPSSPHGDIPRENPGGTVVGGGGKSEGKCFGIE